MRRAAPAIRIRETRPRIGPMVRKNALLALMIQLTREEAKSEGGRGAYLLQTCLLLLLGVALFRR